MFAIARLRLDRSCRYKYGEDAIHYILHLLT
jgi:hypothetical protein